LVGGVTSVPSRLHHVFAAIVDIQRASHALVGSQVVDRPAWQPQASRCMQRGVAQFPVQADVSTRVQWSTRQVLPVQVLLAPTHFQDVEVMSKTQDYDGATSAPETQNPNLPLHQRGTSTGCVEWDKGGEAKKKEICQRNKPSIDPCMSRRSHSASADTSSRHLGHQARIPGGRTRCHTAGVLRISKSGRHTSGPCRTRRAPRPRRARREKRGPSPCPVKSRAAMRWAT
jgi:hypothetical protein